MIKNNCTLLIDGNWLLMSKLHLCKNSFDISNDDEIKIKATDELTDVMLRSISFTLKKFEYIIDNIIFVCDGQSWRKQVDIPKSRQNILYKGNRTKESVLDWDYIYQSLNNLMNDLSSNNCTVSRCDNTEGDDLIYYWSRRLNNNGINTIIWSTDCDLKQLLCKHENGSFTAWYNDYNGLCLSNAFDVSNINSIDFFMNVENSTMNALKQVINTDNIHYVNPDDIIMNKIVCGDASDNIKSLILQEKNQKTYRITEKVWNDLKENVLKINNIDDFYSKKDIIIDKLCELKNVDKSHYNDISEIFEYNKTLVHLNDDNYPKYIKQQLNEIGDYKLFDVNYMINNYKSIDESLNDDDVIETFFSI